jgi:transposase
MEHSSQAVGIDVSKATLDIALLQAPLVLSKRLANQRSDFDSALRWMQAHANGPLHVCVEPTGTYHDQLVAYLREQGVKVSIVVPSRIAAFRRSEGSRHKTDKQDAILLASFCQQKQPAASVAVAEDLTHLRMLLSRLDQLARMQQAERNRLENGRVDESIRAQIGEHRQTLNTWCKQLQEQIRTWIKEHEPMSKAMKLLRSIKGIGEVSGWYLLAIIGPDASRFPSAYQLTVYLGLDVVKHESGTSVRGVGHISKQGSPRVRGVLGMCAIVAKRWDPDMNQWAGELTGRGKKGLVVRVAMMRKLLSIAYGVLKSQKPYDRSRAWPTHQHGSQEEPQAA